MNTKLNAFYEMNVRLSIAMLILEIYSIFGGLENVFSIQGSCIDISVMRLFAVLHFLIFDIFIFIFNEKF